MRRRMATLLLVRHGQASYGEVDYDRLSVRGQSQAREVGQFLAGARIDRLFVGPPRRHVDTAALAADGAGNLPLPPTLTPLAEYPAVELIQRLAPKIIAEDAKSASLATAPSRELANEAFHTILNRWARDEWDDVDGIERVTDFAARVQRGLDRIVRAVRSGARIAV